MGNLPRTTVGQINPIAAVHDVGQEELLAFLNTPAARIAPATAGYAAVFLVFAIDALRAAIRDAASVGH